MTNGLRWDRSILSPLLFLLYVSSFVDMLKEARMGGWSVVDRGLCHYYIHIYVQMTSLTVQYACVIAPDVCEYVNNQCDS